MTGSSHPRSFAPRARILSLLVAWAALSGCTAVVGGELDGLRTDRNAKRNVQVSLRDFSPHIGQLVDVQFVRPAANEDERDQVLGRATVNPTPGDCVDVRLRRGVPVSASRIDFYADLNGNGVVDPPPMDHSWREDLEEDGRLLFVHDVEFADLSGTNAAQLFLNPLQVEVTGLEEFEGAQAVVTLVGQDLVDPVAGVRRETVPALYATQVSEGAVTFTQPGVADPGSFYDVELILGDFAQRCVLEEQRAPAVENEPMLVQVDLSALSCTDATPPDCAGLDERCDEGEQAACDELARQCPFEDCAR